MKITYNEILENMKNAFYEKCGENVNLMGDIGIRFQSVASELFSLYCYGDFILKQAFPQSAVGEHLDYHAQLRDIKRKTPSKSKGVLTFSVSEPAQSSVQISKGTVCSVAGKPFIQYETDENVTIKVGELSASVSATALETGAEYNTQPETINVMVNPPLGVTSVTNIDSFSGGYDLESDESLRKRIISSYRVPSTGVSAQSLRDVVLKLDDVIDCKIQESDLKRINTYVRTKSGELSGELIADIRNALMIGNIASCTTNVYLANEIECNINIEVYSSSADKESVIKNVKQAVTDYAGTLLIGESINLNKVACVAAAVDDVDYCDVSSDNSTNGTIICDNKSYLRLVDIEVICYD